MPLLLTLFVVIFIARDRQNLSQGIEVSFLAWGYILGTLLLLPFNILSNFGIAARLWHTHHIINIIVPMGLSGPPPTLAALLLLLLLCVGMPNGSCGIP